MGCGWWQLQARSIPLACRSALDTPLSEGLFLSVKSVSFSVVNAHVTHVLLIVVVPHTTRVDSEFIGTI